MATVESDALVESLTADGTVDRTADGRQLRGRPNSVTNDQPQSVLTRIKSLIVVAAIAMSPFAAIPVRANVGDNSQITPVVTITPNLFPAGEISNAFICITNGNPSSTKSIQTGDTFSLTLDATIGVVSSVGNQVLVNSSNLNAADFTAHLGGAPNRIIISYQGETKLFTPGDSFCVKVTFTASSAIGSGKLTGEVPALGGDDGRYNNVDPKFTTVSIVDFATGPQGPPGPGSVTSVSASSPLSVTNPTTTPNISLGVVPTAKGGTGLSSAGASGSFLRSNGSGWASVPMSASDVPPGSSFYLQNTASQQAPANFNISGNGAANMFDAATQYNIGGSRILSNAGANNLFAGIGAGAANTGQSNSFFGNSAGLSNTTGNFSSFFGSGAGRANTGGSNNSFFGSDAGAANTTGFQNSFFGREAGLSNTTGSFNSFLGRSAGRLNTTGNANSFFGQDSGGNNTTGSRNAFFGNSSGQGNLTGGDNAFFGPFAGFNNTTGGGNAFLGNFAGDVNTTGSNNTIIGVGANVGAVDLNFATAVGSGAVVSASNTLVLGRSADTVRVPGSLSVTGGNILVGSPGQGIILKSPGGATCRLLGIDNAGAITLTAVACP